MAKHFAAKKFGADLRAKTDAEKGLVVTQRHANPFDFATNEIVAVIGAHRAAENDRRGMLGHRLRQRLAEARPPHVKRVAELLERMAEPAGSRMLLVENDHDGMRHELNQRITR